MNEEQDSPNMEHTSDWRMREEDMDQMDDPGKTPCPQIRDPATNIDWQYFLQQWKIPEQLWLCMSEELRMILTMPP